jgi:hypothetical protein
MLADMPYPSQLSGDVEVSSFFAYKTSKSAGLLCPSKQHSIHQGKTLYADH